MKTGCDVKPHHHHHHHHHQFGFHNWNVGGGASILNRRTGSRNVHGLLFKVSLCFVSNCFSLISQLSLPTTLCRQASRRTRKQPANIDLVPSKAVLTNLTFVQLKIWQLSSLTHLGLPTSSNFASLASAKMKLGQFSLKLKFHSYHALFTMQRE